MLRILRDRFLRLGRDDDGVALVATLAVFMFMWLVCIGVYAIGTAVKTRIHLQNACDAAAYSAAVVQADTLSRIATINRAMSWTYIAMTRRQMDYIVWKWLDHAQTHVYQDASDVISRGDPGDRSHLHPYWYVGYVKTDPGTVGYTMSTESLATLSVNGSVTSIVEVAAATTAFKEVHLPGKRASFYSSLPTIFGLQKQIDDDKQTIEAMNEAEKQLAEGMPTKIKEAAESVFAANCDPKWKVLPNTPPFVHQSESPRLEYMRVLDGAELGLPEEELWFLSFAKYFPSANKPFDKGSGASEWFPLSGSGIKRSYEQRKKLYAEWYSWSCAWVCKPTCGFTTTTPSCGHQCADCNSGSCDKCQGWSVRHAYLEAGHLRPDIYNGRDLYEGVAASPLVLRQKYFDKEGTITVGIAVENQNPWLPVLGRIVSIFTAFNPFVEWTVCLASAKAGYKFLDEDIDNQKHAYRIDWKPGSWYTKEQSWNLCQSDWDAVLIPVRRAESLAEDEIWWKGEVSDFLNGYVADGLGVSRNEMRAGGLNDYDALIARDLDDASNPAWRYEFRNWRHLARERSLGPNGQLGANWRERWPDDPDERMNWAANVQWQVGNQGGPVNWGRLQEVMFH